MSLSAISPLRSSYTVNSASQTAATQPTTDADEPTTPLKAASQTQQLKSALNIKYNMLPKIDSFKQIRHSDCGKIIFKTSIPPSLEDTLDFMGKKSRDPYLDKEIQAILRLLPADLYEAKFQAYQMDRQPNLTLEYIFTQTKKGREVDQTKLAAYADGLFASLITDAKTKNIFSRFLYDLKHKP